MNLNIKDIYSALMLFYGMITIFPLFNYFGLRGIHSALFVVLVVSIIGIIGDKKISVKLTLVFFSLFVLALISAIQWMDIKFVFFPIFLVASIALVFFAGDSAISRFCTISTVFIFLSVTGAVISFFIARAGVGPLFTFPNPDGRLSYFFYTSFTNTYLGTYIRPSGFFDEPGAFSFFICFVAAMRHLLDRSRKITWFILIFGFITFSLAHLVYVFFHLIAERLSIKNILYSISIIPIIFGAGVLTGLNTDVTENLILRLAMDDTGTTIAGDNRSTQFGSAWDQIVFDPTIILFGIDRICVVDFVACKEKFDNMGENPLTPLVYGGLFLNWPYYVLLIFFLVTPLFGKKYFVVFGMALLFSQRPYIMYVSYSLAAVLTAFLTIKSLKTDKAVSKISRVQKKTFVLRARTRSISGAERISQENV